MPNYKQLHITNPATGDLKRIAEYTERTWGMKQKAKYIAQIQTCFAALCNNTNLGKLYEELDNTLYSHVCQKHMIFYRVGVNSVNVIRVLHQSMDFTTQFTGNK
ncbi:MAG: type II toxin-antitoxin system RelE/ParE family toxin [Mariprofundaceae bacterium]|nr:type II toxin-antitoxin system RelE/ParE family toxin [Mariprofundaceae bacterium]